MYMYTAALFILLLVANEVCGTKKLILDDEIVRKNMAGLSGKALKQSLENAESPNQITIAALGRPFTLGSLYDATKDTLILGYKLWNEEAIKASTITTKLDTMDYNYIDTETTTDSFDLFDMGASISASFAGGLFDVSGSARYLQQTVKSNYDATLTYFLKIVRNHKTLELGKLKTLDNNKVFDLNPSATHVVTAIKYGGNAMLELTQRAKTTSDKTQIQGHLMVSAALALVKISGEAHLNQSSTANESYSRMTCKYNGDVVLDKAPSTFEQAREAVTELHGKMTADVSVPLWVSMQPVKQFNGPLNRLVIRIEEDLLDDILGRVDKFAAVNRDIVDLTIQPTYSKLPTFKKLVDQVIDGFQRKRRTFQGILAENIPKVRGPDKGLQKEGTNSIRALLDEVNTKYPFEKIMKMVEQMVVEASVLNKITEDPNVSKLLVSRGEFEEILYSYDVNYVVALVFNLYRPDEAFVNCFLNQCEQKKCGNVNCYDPIQYSSWIDTKFLKKRMRNTEMDFINLVGQGLCLLFMKLCPREIEFRKKITWHDKSVINSPSNLFLEFAGSRLVIKPEPLRVNSDGPRVTLRVYAESYKVVDNFVVPRIEASFETADDCKSTVVSWTIKKLTDESKSLMDGVLIKYFALDSPDNVMNHTSSLDESRYEVPLSKSIQINILVLCKFGICSQSGSWNSFRGIQSEHCKEIEEEDIVNEWELKVKTSGQDWSDSQSDLYFIIDGTFNKTDKRTLGKKFLDKGAIDTFTFETNGVGFVNSVTIGTNNNDGWLMDEAWLKSKTKKTEYHFKLRKWLDIGSPGDYPEYKLKPDWEKKYTN